MIFVLVHDSPHILLSSTRGREVVIKLGRSRGINLKPLVRLWFAFYFVWTVLASHSASPDVLSLRIHFSASLGSRKKICHGDGDFGSCHGNSRQHGWSDGPDLFMFSQSEVVWYFMKRLKFYFMKPEDKKLNKKNIYILFKSWAVVRVFSSRKVSSVY